MCPTSMCVEPQLQQEVWHLCKRVDICCEDREREHRIRDRENKKQHILRLYSLILVEEENTYSLFSAVFFWAPVIVNAWLSPTIGRSVGWRGALRCAPNGPTTHPNNPIGFRSVVLSPWIQCTAISALCCAVDFVGEKKKQRSYSYREREFHSPTRSLLCLNTGEGSLRGKMNGAMGWQVLCQSMWWVGRQLVIYVEGIAWMRSEHRVKYDWFRSVRQNGKTAQH